MALEPSSSDSNTCKPETKVVCTRRQENRSKQTEPNVWLCGCRTSSWIAVGEGVSRNIVSVTITVTPHHIEGWLKCAHTHREHYSENMAPRQKSKYNVSTLQGSRCEQSVLVCKNVSKTWNPSIEPRKSTDPRDLNEEASWSSSNNTKGTIAKPTHKFRMCSHLVHQTPWIAWHKLGQFGASAGSSNYVAMSQPTWLLTGRTLREFNKNAHSEDRIKNGHFGLLFPVCSVCHLWH